jgi:CRISPR-associated protein (TIGR03986 family)
MSEQVRSGVLRWDPDRGRLIIAEEGGEVRAVRKAQRDLAGDLKDQELADLDGIPVDFTWHGGQARAIRRAGDPAPARQARRPDPPDPDAFHNPYAFVPAQPRDGIDSGLADTEHAGPAGHHRLRPQLWTGKIAVNLTVETPLLLLDTSRAEPVGDQGHVTYPVLLRNGVPHLAPTAVKGMLRSAYEAITNSRFGVFDKHADRLGYRMPASQARSMIPARISNDGSKVVLLPGDTPVGGQLEPNPVLHGAWLPQYLTGSGNSTYPGGLLPSHREEAEAIVELFQHYYWRKGALSEDFRVWRVRALAPVGSGQLPSISKIALSSPEDKYVPIAGTPMKHILGHVFVTNQNFGRKHDERIFFEGSEPSAQHALTDQLRCQWQETIRSYRDAHADREIHRVRNGLSIPPNRYCGRDPGETAWSPHQYDNSYLSLSPGDLCYALVDANSKIRGLYPVMISRGLHNASPRALLHRSLLPAEDMSKLSPADRVFGWAHASGVGAYKGQLRIGPVTCEQGRDSVHDDAADFGEHGVPLAILGRPRPQQGRFYLADRQTRPQDGLGAGQHKDQWYREGQGLRGRKIYPHHAGLAEDYWDKPIEDRTQLLDSAGRYQEYRQPRKGTDKGELTPDKKAFLIPAGADEQRSDQNRSVRGWIRPGSLFRFTIEIENLTDVELGALAWLICLPKGHFHRIGYGKPLGFGSVRLDAETSGTDLRRGADWIARYRSLRTADDPQDPGHADAVLASAISSFTQAAGGKQAKPALYIAAFLAAARGNPIAPVHYPRARPYGMDIDVPVPPDPRGRSFSWFQLNEKEQNGKVVPGRGRSLPSLGGEPLMTYQEDPPRSSGASTQPRSR